MWAALLITAVGAVDYEVGFVPSDAVAFALADAATYPPERLPALRWVWTDGTKEQNAAVSFAANTAVSRASVPIRCAAVAGGRLVRIELDTLRPKDADLRRAVELWEKQAGQDNAFYVRQTVKVAAYKADDGKTYDYKWATTFGSWVDIKAGVMLQGLTKSSAPIERADHFIVKTLTQIDGGLYYDWAGIRKSQQAGRTDFGQFLNDHGVVLEKSEELNAARRSAVKISKVTNTPRATQEENGPNGGFFFTEDVAKGNDNVESDPFKELERPKKDAVEAIALRPNGFCSFGIFNGKEELVDVVPSIIARDTTQPPGFQELAPAMSCIRCHGIGKGFRSERNDFADMLKAKARRGLKFDLLASEKEKDQQAFRDRIAGKYRGDLTRITRARDDYSDAVFLATGGMSVEAVSLAVQEIDDGFRFTPMTPQRACSVLGVSVSEDKAVETLQILLPPDSAPGGREDDDVFALTEGKSITAASWDKILPDVLLRSRPAYEQLAKEKAKK